MVQPPVENESGMPSSEPAYARTIGAIGALAWERLTEQECISTAWAYYFFSIQFRESLLAARRLHPQDEKLQDLERGECDTDNLSPWPGVADAGEAMNHDEFMRRAVELAAIPEDRRQDFEQRGQSYLRVTRAMDDETRAMSIASYEDGGLEHVFGAMLRMPASQHPTLAAFRHFLAEHIRFDSNPDEGHGALARHLQPDDRIKPLWDAFHDLLVAFAPSLAAAKAVPARVLAS